MGKYRTSIIYHWNKAQVALTQAHQMHLRGWEDARQAVIADFHYHLNQCKQFRGLEARGGW